VFTPLRLASASVKLEVNRPDSQTVKRNQISKLFIVMDSDASTFISAVWQYKPVIIVLAVGGLIIFFLSVIDTHRHRKKEHKKRHRTRHH
jgi:hypothetical protein